MYFTMYNPQPSYPPTDPRHPRRTEGPAGQARRRAPEVDLEWPASEPPASRPTRPALPLLLFAFFIALGRGTLALALFTLTFLAAGLS